MGIARWSLRLRVFLFFALLGAGSALLFGAGLWLAAGRIGPGSGEPLVLFGGAAILAVVVLIAWVWQLFDQNIVRPIQLLSGEMLAKAHARHSGGALSAEPARYLGGLADAAGSIAQALASARTEGEAALARSMQAVLAEKAQLEAVLRDLRECVLICNPDHEILLYNSEAQRLLGAAGEIGLGRPLFRLITQQPILHALERLRNRYASGRYRTHHDYLSVATVCATRDGKRTLQGRIALILNAAGDGIDGFVATFRDATAIIAEQAARDHLLSDTLEGLRRPAANIKAAVEMLTAAPEMAEPDRARFLAVLDEEAERLGEGIEGLSASYNELRPGGWSMNDVTSTALVSCVHDRLGAAGPQLVHEGAPAWLNCDSFSVVELLTLLAGRIAARAGVGRIAVAATRSGAHVYLDLSWPGDPAAVAETGDWLDAPLLPALGALSGRDVLSHHRTGFWCEPAGDLVRLRLPLPPPVEDHESAPAEVLPPRPEFYDFTLLSRPVSHELAERPLRALRYVVFDTETTGLYPSAGDEIVQIAGVRMIGLRILRGEVFDRLVDPGRRIPAASTRVHGITDEMVVGQRRAAEVLPDFHEFAAGSVLVAHNAPFDMKFLRLKEGAAGLRFDHPVLDTVLLSAHLFGQEAEHTLDALAGRFAVAIPEGLRHTAMADAMVTAEVFARLLEVLEARGVNTLAALLAVSEEAGAIRRRQAAY